MVAVVSRAIPLDDWPAPAANADRKMRRREIAWDVWILLLIVILAAMIR